MKYVTYTDPDSNDTSRFVVKVGGKRHKFHSGQTVTVADDVAAALKTAAPDGAVKVDNAPDAKTSDDTAKKD